MTCESLDFSNVTIVPIAAQHIESFHAALDSVAREKKYLTMLEAPPLLKTHDFVLDMIKQGNPQVVAIYENEVVGWCDISRHYFPSHAHRGSLGMGIITPYRGQGLGRKLIETALASARQANFKRIELSVYANNLPAIALYEKVGFAREGVVHCAARIDGKYLDAINMALLFKDNQDKN